MGSQAGERWAQPAEALLDALDPEQRAVAAQPVGPMCVLAGAGTGKTRAITHRIAYGVRVGAYPPSGVLAVTFTARAAGEMRTRLRDLGVVGVQARTFHAAALRQLHYFWPQAVGGAAPQVLASKAAVVAEAAARLSMSFDRTTLRDLAAEIEWAKVSLLTPQSYAEHARRRGRDPAGVDLIAMARLYAEYEHCKSDRGVADFEDVLLLTAGILQDRPEIAAAVRSQYRHFVVDEYQDVNSLQQRLLDLWLGERRELCVVGDPAQTIYSFTGATSKHLLQMPTRYPEVTTVRLVRNYRSTPQIVALANTVLRSARVGPPSAGRRTRAGLPLVSRYAELVAQREAGPEPTLSAYPDDVAEAAGVAAAVAERIADGVPAARIAILYRVNAQSEAFESALAARDIPYLVRGGERFFARAEVRQALVLLRGAARSDTGDKALGETVRDILVGAGWSHRAPAAGGATRERWESLTALAVLADDLAAVEPAARVPELIRELDERAAAQHAPTVQGVTLASLHAAKGLEWDVVFLVGCSDGLLPISMAEGPQAIDEEHRLFYVGITRARDRIALSWAAARSPGGRASRRPSRFLEPAAGVLGSNALPDGGGRAAPSRSPRHVVRTCSGCGRTLDTAAERKVGRCPTCPPNYDEATFERLRQWRADTAKAASVPAYVVFTDATLIAIAESGATTAQHLAAISGVGPRKLSLYADEVLAVLAGSSD